MARALLPSQRFIGAHAARRALDAQVHVMVESCFVCLCECVERAHVVHVMCALVAVAVLSSSHACPSVGMATSSSGLGSSHALVDRAGDAEVFLEASAPR